MPEVIDVLLIEDHESFRTLLSAVLTQNGYSLRTAANGRNAMALLKQYSFRLLITDIYMPEMDGFEVIIAQQSLNPGIPILAMSGGTYHSPAEENLKMARILGSHATITKPFALADFVDAVRSLLPLGAGPNPPNS